MTSDGTAAAASPAAPASRATTSLAEQIVGKAVGDRVYTAVITGFALMVPLLLVLIFWEVALAGWPAMKQFGFGFLTSSDWDPVRGHFGAASAIFGTVVTSILALVIATPLALGVSIFLPFESTGKEAE